MDAKKILQKLNQHSNPENAAGMAHFGINPEGTLGISMPVIRQMAKEIGKSHELATELWESGIHEARILASLVDIPSDVTAVQADKWVSEFDSWDVCDQCVMNLLDKTPFADKKAIEWSRRYKEFEKRAGFAMMASLAVHDKKAGNEMFESFLPIIINEADDDRNFVKKAINWALRQIGKRNEFLHKSAMKTVIDIMNKFPDSISAQWITKDALKELTNPKTFERMNKKRQHYEKIV